MNYLHGYFELYPPTETQVDCPVRHGILLTAILSMTLKVLTQDYVIEYLPIREQLLLFDVHVPSEEYRLQMQLQQKQQI